MRYIIEFRRRQLPAQYSYPANKNVIVKNIVLLDEQSETRNCADILYENDITRVMIWYPVYFR